MLPRTPPKTRHIEHANPVSSARYPWQDDRKLTPDLLRPTNCWQSLFPLRPRQRLYPVCRRARGPQLSSQAARDTESGQCASGREHDSRHQLSPTARRCIQAFRRNVRAPCYLWESMRSEEHTSELQSPCNLVCRLLLEKKKRHVTVS